MAQVDRKDRWVDSIFRSLSPTEKVGQLLMTSVSAKPSTEEIKILNDQVKANKIGSLFFAHGGPVQFARSVNKLQSLAKIPLLISADITDGLARTFDSTMSFYDSMVLMATANDSLKTTLDQELKRQIEILGIPWNLNKPQQAFGDLNFLDMRQLPTQPKMKKGEAERQAFLSGNDLLLIDQKNIDAAIKVTVKSLKKDKALTDAVSKQTWDPSIQAMAALPDVVKRLADDIQWTTDIGNAFLAQQGEVMDAVQRMRTKAQGTGALKSNEQQKVETQVVESKTVIVVEQANPEVVYVPSYNPEVVYGAAAYPYPPIYYPPSTGAVIAASAISFGVGVAIGAAWGGGGWGWNTGWGNNDVNINRNNSFNRNTSINNISGNRGGNQTWQHNPQHRGGAPYSNRATAQRYGGTTRGDSLANRQTGARQQVGRQGGNLPSTRDANRGGLGDRGGVSDRASNIGDRGGVSDRAGTSGNRGGLSDHSPGGGNRTGAGGDRIGGVDVPRSSGSRDRDSFGGGSGGFDGGAARASSSRGASSMGGGGGFGGGGGGGGMRGGGGGGMRGGGGRRR